VPIIDVETLAHLLAFDSTDGRLPAPISHTDDSILVDGRPIQDLSLRDPGTTQWGDLEWRWWSSPPEVSQPG
jgi:glyceraldehyde 3-phosphate dehydrogenase